MRIGLICVFLISTHAVGGDWPQWRYDGGRTAASPAELPQQLHLAWVNHYSPRTPVWDDPLNQDLMPYDSVFEPVVECLPTCHGADNPPKYPSESYWQFFKWYMANTYPHYAEFHEESN